MKSVPHKFEGVMQSEDFEEVIEIMADVCGDVGLNDPMKCLCKEVEDIQCGTASEAEDDVVVKPVVPGEAEEWPVGRAYGDVEECFLEVEF